MDPTGYNRLTLTKPNIFPQNWLSHGKYVGKYISPMDPMGLNSMGRLDKKNRITLVGCRHCILRTLVEMWKHTFKETTFFFWKVFQELFKVDHFNISKEIYDQLCDESFGFRFENDQLKGGLSEGLQI